MPSPARPPERSPTPSRFRVGTSVETMMGKGILLWLIGVPIPIILLLWLFFH